MSVQLLFPPLLAAVLAAAALMLGAVAAYRSGDRLQKLRRAALGVLTATLVFTPTVPRTETVVGVNVEVYVAVDLTGSMAAEDYDGNKPRLDGVRADLRQLVAELPGARFSVVSYSSTATRQLPLTTDGRAVVAWGDTARQELTAYSSGSAIDRPVKSLEKILKTAAEANPHAERLLFVLTDGESSTRTQAEGDTKNARAFGALKPYISGGAVLGYGTASGANMREYDGTSATGAGSDGAFIIDKATGRPAVSKLDAKALQTAASALDVPYLHRTAPGPLDLVIDGAQLTDLVSQVDRQVTINVPRYFVAPLLIAILGAFEVFAIGRNLGELRNPKRQVGAR